MNPTNAAAIIGGVALWVAIAVRWKRLSRRPARDLLITYICLATVAFFGDINVYRTIDEHLPGRGLAAAIRDLIVLVAVASLCNWVAEVDAGGRSNEHDAAGQQVRVRRQRAVHWVSVLMLGAISVLPWIYPQRPPTAFPVLARTPDWLDDTWRTPIHILPLVVATFWAIFVSWRSAVVHAHAERGAIQRSLYIVAAGTVLCLPFVLLKAATAVLWVSGYGPATISVITQAEQAGQAVSLGLVGFGSTNAVVLMRRERRAANRSLAQLAGLWALVPEHLQTPATGDPIADLAEQTAVINDLFLELTPYGSDAVRNACFKWAATSGVPDESAHAIADATWLTDALAARVAGHQQSTRCQVPASSTDSAEATRRLVAIAASWRETSASNIPVVGA